MQKQAHSYNMPWSKRTRCRSTHKRCLWCAVHSWFNRMLYSGISHCSGIRRRDCSYLNRPAWI